MEIKYEDVGRFTINNDGVLEIWDHLIEWLKGKSVRGAVAYEEGAGGISPHLDITIQFQPLTYKIQSANIRQVLCRKVDASKWSIKKHKVNEKAGHRYELLVAGYARKECNNPNYKYVEWGHEGIDLTGAEKEYNSRVRNAKLIPVHSTNWWAMCLAYSEANSPPQSRWHLKDVVIHMFNSGKYDLKWLVGKITYEHMSLFNLMVSGHQLTSQKFDELFIKHDKF